LEVRDAAPTADQFIRRVRFWDLASTEAQAGVDPDYTAGVLMGKHKDGSFWVLDVVHQRLGPAGVRGLIRQTATLDTAAVQIRLEREGGASGKLAADAIVREDLVGFSAAAIRPEGSKAERADPFASQIEAGNVRVVRLPTTAALLHELRGFPSAAHDDIVDACSGAFRELSRGGGGWAVSG
jgi:predicted phage terminase large subunit-like protein